MKRIGEKHPQYEFMKILATKCSYVFFGREHVQVIMKELSAYKESGTKDLVTASLSLLVVGESFFAGISFKFGLWTS